MKGRTLLAGDIGGTKTILALYDQRPDGPICRRAEQTYISNQYQDLSTMVRQFMTSHQVTADRACFGVAGPVIDGRARITKLPWILAEEELATDLDIPQVKLINDMVAMATAIPLLAPTDLHTISPGQPDPQGVIGIVAPGTGLGEAFLTWDDGHYVAQASEGGHSGFAPSCPRELDLLRFLWHTFDHVSSDRVCSGQGIPQIYQFLKENGAAPEPPWLTKELTEAIDPAPIIVQAAVSRSRADELCRLSLEIFTDILATEAGNLCLKVLATGGIYLGGGIPPRILDFLTPEKFLPPFNRKGRMHNMMKRIPIHVILHPQPALLGAASYGAGLP